MPRVVDIAEKRAAFVDASWRVIAEEGLRAASLRRVATAAGCTTGSLTHYFPDRQTLLVTALRAVHERAGERMRSAVADVADPLDRLRRVVDEALPLEATSLQEWRVWLAFWSECMFDEVLASENERRYAEWAAALVQLLADLVPADRVAAEVAEWIALVDGLGLGVARHRNDGAGLEAARVVARALVDARLAEYATDSGT